MKYWHNLTSGMVDYKIISWTREVLLILTGNDTLWKMQQVWWWEQL